MLIRVLKLASKARYGGSAFSVYEVTMCLSLIVLSIMFFLMCGVQKKRGGGARKLGDDSEMAKFDGISFIKIIVDHHIFLICEKRGYAFGCSYQQRHTSALEKLNSLIMSYLFQDSCVTDLSSL